MQQISNYWGLVWEYTAIKDSCSKSSLFDDNDDDDDEEDNDDYNNYAIYINNFIKKFSNNLKFMIHIICIEFLKMIFIIL